MGGARGGWGAGKELSPCPCPQLFQEKILIMIKVPSGNYTHAKI